MKRSLDSDSTDSSSGGGGSSRKKRASTIHKIGVENSQTLAAYLEVSGAGIILWDDFWKAASRLLTGASLESVLQANTSGTDSGGGGDSVMATVDNFIPNQSGGLSDSPPPLLITQYGQEEKDHFDSTTTTSNVASIPATGAASIEESDEELAKGLAAEWGTDQNVWNGTSQSSLTAATTATATTTTTAGTSVTGGDIMTRSTSATAFKSDEDYARELQEQWNNHASYVPNNSNIMDINMISHIPLLKLMGPFESKVCWEIMHELYDVCVNKGFSCNTKTISLYDVCIYISLFALYSIHVYNKSQYF